MWQVAARDAEFLEVEMKEVTTKSKELAKDVTDQVNSPAIHIAGQLVMETMKELENGIPIAHYAPWKDFQIPFALPYFLGATYDGNGNEEEHMHPGQVECYFPLAGEMRVNSWRGDSFRRYSLGCGDVLIVPAGTWHFVEWASPGWCYVIKGPNNLIGDAAKVTRSRS